MEQIDWIEDSKKWCHFSRFGECYGEVINITRKNDDTLYHVKCVCTKYKATKLKIQDIKGFYHTKEEAKSAYLGR